MVSITILLRKPMSGGYLEVNGKIVELDVGDAIIFPSNVEHKVHHVAGGEGELVVWLSGE